MLADEMHYWTFRGQQDASWTLSSTLQRAAIPGRGSILMTGAEEQIIEQFQRRAHHFLPDTPPLENVIDWMALIQHFGGTTRLLDFTKSFYVAAFFAVERATTECAVWCVDHYELFLALKRFLNLGKSNSRIPHWQTLHKTATLVETFLKTRKTSFEKFVLEVQPFKLNERLAVQQGVFLCPLSLDVPYMESLAATFGLTAADFADSKIEEFKPPTGSVKQMLEGVVVLKLLLPLSIQHDVLQDLWNMNVNAASLFPGLDGLARSLNYHVRIQNLWDIKYAPGRFENVKPT